MSMRRLTAVLAGLAMAATLIAVLVVGVMPEKADAASRYKVVTKTFPDWRPIAIPSYGGAEPYPRIYDVRGFKQGKILDVNLTLHAFSHYSPEDVDVLLYHRGVDRTVMSDVGLGGYYFQVNNVTFKLDDESEYTLGQTLPLPNGTFKPNNSGDGVDFFYPAPAPPPSGLSKLSGFDGKNPNGPWQLYILDDTDGNAGQFAGGYSLTIKARVLR